MLLEARISKEPYVVLRTVISLLFSRERDMSARMAIIMRVQASVDFRVVIITQHNAYIRD